MKLPKTGGGLGLALWIASLTSVSADTTNYFTQFEASEGFTVGTPLVVQGGWDSQGSGGNGILTGFGLGQSAYVGREVPNTGEDALFAWRSVNLDPLINGEAEVKFSTRMAIIDSDNDNWDNFRWVVFNQQVDFLFELDFDNYTLHVNYVGDGGNFVDSGVTFQNGTFYDLTVIMNFANNVWSATLDNNLIATNQPITSLGAPLNIADMDALWLVYDADAPGNNYMVFDNFSITSRAPDVPPPAPPVLTLLSKTATEATLHVTGEDGRSFAIDATTNLTDWEALSTNVITGGYFDTVDFSVSGVPERYYRARLVP